jgi:UDP-galactopyranose mutase
VLFSCFKRRDILRVYDYLIVGSGPFGATFAYLAKQAGKTCLIIDKRKHVGGNLYCENIAGINVHKYGAHIFHTSNKDVWDFVNQFVEFNRYTNSPIAIYKNELYNLPFNMNTFSKMWGITTPSDARAKIELQIKDLNIADPKNLEEQALKLVGKDIYYKLIKGYTEKQWGRSATEIPAFVIKRLPVRFTYDNNYFNDDYQGIPIGGYNVVINKLLEGIEVRLNTDFFENKIELELLANKIVYTGQIDEYFDYCYGELQYRGLQFEHEILDTDNYQGNAVVNYTEYEVPYTRIIEHKHFEFGTQEKTVITREYSSNWKRGEEPYYPINDEYNQGLYQKYKQLADKQDNVIFGGRLAEYKYYDMHQVIERAMYCVKLELLNND